MVEISDREDLERWLTGKPREWSALIAARAALRALPMLTTALEFRSGGIPKIGVEIVLPAFRAMAAPWIAGTWPTHGAEIGFAAGAAAAAAGDAAHIIGVGDAKHAANAAAFASATVAAIVATATDAANAAVATVRATNDHEIWPAISADATALESEGGLKSSALGIQRLWPTRVPVWATENWMVLKLALLTAKEDWDVWIDWYEARLRGISAIEELELARVMIADEIWRQGPKVVNAHIKELIEQYEQPPSPGPPEPKNETMPSVPAQSRAAIEPIWSGGRLTLPRQPARIDLTSRNFLAALSALRTELHDLADDVSAEANIDKRPAIFITRLADRIPERAPTQDELFRLGHAEEILKGFVKTVTQEWPDFLGSRYQASLLQFDRTLRQSPLWREFKQNAAKGTLTDEQIAVSPALAKEMAQGLRQYEANEFAEQMVSTSLDQLADTLNEMTGIELVAFDPVEAGTELLAADLIESVNNTLKPIAEAALSFTIDYAKDAAKGFKGAAKKQAPNDGEKAFKWLRRIAITSTVGAAGAAASPHFAALVELLGKYPHAFEWLTHVLKFFS